MENIQLEASVLGTILYDNNTLYRLLDFISPDCFAEALHKEIYIAAKQMIDEGEVVSPVRLSNKFPEKKAYLATLVSKSKPLTVVSDAKLLSDLMHRRRLFKIYQDGLASLEDYDKTAANSAAAVIDNATKVLAASTGNKSILVTDQAEEIYKELISPNPPYKAKTGLRCVDYGMAGGLQKSRVYAFMAAPKVGKTLIATTISNHLCESGHKHLFVAAEMGSRELTQRMLGGRLGVSTNAFLEPPNEEFKNKVFDEVGKLKRNIIFENVPGVDFEELKSLVELHVIKNKIEGFILDYYQLVGGCEKGQTQAQHLENVANWVHRVCKRHNIWCILLVQTNDDQQVLGSRGLNRACDQGYLIERPLDDKGDPMGSIAWLKLRFSRYTKTYNFGNQDRPCLEIHKNGTHFVEISWHDVDHSS